jgi:hypothetical protein
VLLTATQLAGADRLIGMFGIHNLKTIRFANGQINGDQKNN